MINELEKAKSFVNKYRYSDDILDSNFEIDSQSYKDIISNLSHQNLEISSYVTPSLSKSLNRVIKRLQIPSGSIQAFVYPSEELQASSLVTGSDSTILRLSSSLINLLDEHELEFIIGHELGHYLLDHGPHDHNEEELNHESLRISRYKEISADRIGLLACNSIDNAIRSMFKLISGLNSKHLRFDTMEFLNQINKSKHTYNLVNTFSTHPTILFRCRALIWLSMTDSVNRGHRYYKKDDFKKLDERIRKDLKDFIDGPVLQKIEEAKNNYKMWLVTKKINMDGVFSKEEQKIFINMFDKESMSELIQFLKGIPKIDRDKTIMKKIDDASIELRNLIPSTYEDENNKISDKIDLVFKNK